MKFGAILGLSLYRLGVMEFEYNNCRYINRSVKWRTVISSLHFIPHSSRLLKIFSFLINESFPLAQNVTREEAGIQGSAPSLADVFKSVKKVFGWVYLHTYLLFSKLQALIGVNVGIKQSRIYDRLNVSSLCDTVGWLEIIQTLLFRYQPARQNLEIFAILNLEKPVSGSEVLAGVRKFEKTNDVLPRTNR